jgi:hypothetical protein
MAVVAVGYEGEARVFDRALLGTRALRAKVLADDTGALARQWLDGKLKASYAEALRASFPDVPAANVSDLYRELSGDVHPDIARLISVLVRDAGSESEPRELWWGPQRTTAARRSLFLYAWMAAEATEQLGVGFNIDLPHHQALASALLRHGAALRNVSQ